MQAELAEGTFPFRQELEDIHLNIERRLTELAGPVGGKLHTGRSRNDQIALDERLYLREIIDRWPTTGCEKSRRALLARAEEHVGAAMPGYTHLQRAQPVLLAHHLLAYVFMLQRDRERFADCAARATTCCPSARPPSRAPPSPSTARPSRAIWASPRPPPTAWTR